MKCDICGDVAVIGMPQHRLNLCEAHYVAWVPRMVERAIATYRMFPPDEPILVAVSGGKDSLALWDILIRLGYHTEGLYIHLGIPHEGYSDASEERVRAFARDRDALAWRRASRRPTPGHHALPRAATQAPLLGVRPGQAAHHEPGGLRGRLWATPPAQPRRRGRRPPAEHAALAGGYLRRQAPVLPASHPRLARKVKPSATCTSGRWPPTLLVRGIDYIEDECPYASKATTLFTRSLSRLEARSPGAKMQFYVHFMRARAGPLARRPTRWRPSPTAPAAGSRPADGLCAFLPAVGAAG